MNANSMPGPEPTELELEADWLARNRRWILDDFAEIGKDVALYATPNYWRYEDHDRAKPYQEMLPKLRAVYAEIKTTDKIARIFGLLRWTAKNVIKTGIEANKLRNLMTKLLDAAVDPNDAV